MTKTFTDRLRDSRRVRQVKERMAAMDAKEAQDENLQSEHSALLQKLYKANPGTPEYKEISKKIQEIEEKIKSGYRQMKSKGTQDADKVSVPVRNAARMLLEDGVPESEIQTVVNMFKVQSGYVEMDQVQALAKKYGKGLGSSMFSQ